MTNQADFYRRTEEYLERLMELNPVTATHLGEHRWDDRLGDYTRDGRETQHQEMLEALSEFEAMETESFSPEAQIDHALITHLFQSFIRDYEKVESHRRNPGIYVSEVLGGSFALILRDFAPLSERLRSVLGRVRQVPRVLGEGEVNIDPERTPRIWAEVAVDQVRQAPALFVRLLPALAAQAAPELEDDLREAGETAVAAIEAYAEFLERTVLPQAAGDFAAGEALFNEKLREEHLVGYDAEELLETGWKQFRKTEAQMEELAREIDPDKTVQDLLEEVKGNHPTVEGLLDAYEEAMHAARQYVIDHEIVSIPEGETLRIVETPPYLRPIIPYAAYMPPGMLEEEQEGIFLVTPVDPDAPEKEREQKLRSHHFAKLPVTALHEAYPGHHLQLVWANRQEQVARRVGSFLSTLFSEGWAFYCEELMEQLGYIDAPIQRLGRLSDQLWRAGRIILDVSLHTRQMSVDEAVNFLVEKCRLEPADARAEVVRYTSTPTQPQSYLMGKLLILDLVDDYRSAHPDASLQDVHDAVMACGSLPPRLMRRQLLG